MRAGLFVARFGLPHTRLKWSMARSKASLTAFLWNAEHDSTSFRRSSEGWIPNGTIFDLGSHCQLRLLSKKWTRKSFSPDLNCIRSPSLSTSRGGRGSSSPGNREPVLRARGSIICGHFCRVGELSIFHTAYY